MNYKWGIMRRTTLTNEQKFIILLEIGLFFFTNTSSFGCIHGFCYQFHLDTVHHNNNQHKHNSYHLVYFTFQSRVYPIKGMNVIVMDDDRKVHIEWDDRTQLKLVMGSVAEAESLVCGLATYYRLMDRWTFDLCGSLITPSLVHLNDLKCHGPIGFPAAYEKLQPYGVGYYIVRQCDQTHDTYNLDIKTSTKEVRTFKITRGEGGEWYLHRLESQLAPERFNALAEIARSIRLMGPGQPVRIGPPSQPGELPSLLLCQKQSETRKVVISGDVQGEPKCINPQQLLLRKVVCP